MIDKGSIIRIKNTFEQALPSSMEGYLAIVLTKADSEGWFRIRVVFPECHDSCWGACLSFVEEVC